MSCYIHVNAAWSKKEKWRNHVFNFGVYAITSRADWWSSPCFSSTAKKRKKNARGVPRQTYCDGFLTIESGKTLTFVVKEFLNDLVCKQGRLRSAMSRWKGKEVRILRWDFTDRLYEMDFLQPRERETLDPFILCRKHRWLLPQRSIVRDFRLTSARWSVGLFEDGSHRDSSRRT